MCGRFVASRPVSDVAAIFAVDDVEVPPELVEPRWNVAPQSKILAVTARVRHHGEQGVRRRLAEFHWGLVPSWAKDPSISSRMFNARSESVLEKAAFRAATAKRRCLVPADAFYEWERRPGASGRATKDPWCFRPPDGELLGLGGLWEAWRPRAGAGAGDGDGDGDGASAAASAAEPREWLLSCTILTTKANEVVAAVHDRMPVIVAEEDWEEWLAPEALAPRTWARLLAPAPSDRLEAYRVGAEVSNARNEGPALWERQPA